MRHSSVFYSRSGPLEQRLAISAKRTLIALGGCPFATRCVASRDCADVHVAIAERAHVLEAWLSVNPAASRAQRNPVNPGVDHRHFVAFSVLVCLHYLRVLRSTTPNLMCFSLLK